VTLAVPLGAALLLWPALLNGYPIVFSDTGAFLAQTVVPLMIWDKPWIYGPFAWVFHQHVTLWGTVAAQALMVSHLVWLLARVLKPRGGAPGPVGSAALRHVAVCALLALLTTAPWFAALMMPDILSPVAVLCLALLGWGWDRLGRGERAWVLALGAVAIASHLSNLPVAFAIVVLAALLRRWDAMRRVALPLLGAVALLLATNLVGHGRLALSPHGATFLLARLLADGPAARTIAARCPEAGWYLCGFDLRSFADSDVFLWEPWSPVNRDAAGQPIFLGGARLSPEAREIVAETLRREPLTVARLALGNFARQLTLMRVGDVLSRAAAGESVPPRLAQAFPASELRAYERSLQQADRLAPLAERIASLHPLAVALAVPVVAWALRRGIRARDARCTGLLLCLLTGVAGNALATGALSMPHHRYQARIAWLVPLAAILFAPRQPSLPADGRTPSG
jgi:hypothetical protein